MLAGMWNSLAPFAKWVFSALAGAALIEALHAIGVYPDRWVAGLITTPPSDAQVRLVFWSLVALISAAFFYSEQKWFPYIARKWIGYFRKLPRDTQLASEDKRLPLLKLYERAPQYGITFTNGFVPFTDALRDAARLGDLRFFGRPFNRSAQWSADRQPMSPIPVEHWKDHQIDLTTVVDYDLINQESSLVSDNSKVCTYRTGSQVFGYRDLHVLTEQSLQWLKGEAQEAVAPIVCPNCKYFGSRERAPVCLRNLNVATGSYWSCHDTRADQDRCGTNAAWFEAKQSA